MTSGVILGGDILVIRVSENIFNGEFLAYCVRVNRNQIMQIVSGMTVFHRYGRDMANFVFHAPQVDEQAAIATVLADMDAAIAALERWRDKMRQIRQGMQQELLTGRMRMVQGNAGNAGVGVVAGKRGETREPRGSRGLGWSRGNAGKRGGRGGRRDATSCVSTRPTRT